MERPSPTLVSDVGSWRVGLPLVEVEEVAGEPWPEVPLVEIDVMLGVQASSRRFVLLRSGVQIAMGERLEVIEAQDSQAAPRLVADLARGQGWNRLFRIDGQWALLLDRTLLLALAARTAHG